MQVRMENTHHQPPPKKETLAAKDSHPTKVEPASHPPAPAAEPLPETNK